MPQVHHIAYAEFKAADDIDFKQLVELTDDATFPPLHSEQHDTADCDESGEQDDEHEWTLLDSSAADDVISIDSVMVWHRSFAEMAQLGVDDASDHCVPQPKLRHKLSKDPSETAGVSLEENHDSFDDEDDSMFDDTDIYLHRKTAGGGYARQNRSYGKHQQARAVALVSKERSQTAREERKRAATSTAAGHVNKWSPTEEDLKVIEKQYPRTFYISRTAWGNTKWGYYHRKDILYRSKRDFYVTLWRAIRNDQHEFAQFLLRPNVYKAFWEGHNDSVSLSVTKQLAEFRERMASECRPDADSTSGSNVQSW